MRAGPILKLGLLRPPAVPGLIIALAGIDGRGNEPAQVVVDSMPAPQASAVSDRPAATPRRIPAEERRLSTGVFREGLRQRGLHDLLELHLKDFPLQSPIDEQLMHRDVELARSKDPSRSVEERREAMAAANRILDRLVRENPNDLRRFDWMYALGHSLVFEQAEPYATNILYVGGFGDDVARLRECADPAVEVLRKLEEALSREYDRIDRLAPGEIDLLEKDGYLDRLDRIAPNAEYALLWALFYSAIARPQTDAVSADRLNEIVAVLSKNRAILTLPHEQSHVQVQAHLLAGMTHRRLKDNDAARQDLDRAASIADRLTDPSDRSAVAAPAILAEIESVRIERQEGRWQAASAGLERLHRRIGEQSAKQGEPSFLLRVVAALLEQTVHAAHAESISTEDRPEEAAKYQALAWRGLAELALGEPQRRDELYSILYRSIGPHADPATLDPVQQAALIAGLLADADAARGDSNEYLDRAIAAAERFLASADEQARMLAPEIIRQAAIAYYRKGDRLAAARGFLRIVREHPGVHESLGSAELAVQLASQAYEAARSDPAAVGLYRDALRVLLEQFPQSAQARYWRFFYGELLYELGEFDQASRQYEQVSPQHEQFLEAGLRRIQVQAAALERRARADAQADLVDLRSRADEILSTLRELIIRAEVLRGADVARNDEIDRVLAEARLTAAETAVLPPVGRFAQALTDLDDFEQRFADGQAVGGRLWRVRLLAFAGLGRLDDVRGALGSYVAADRDGSGPTLQLLFQSAAAEAERLESTGDREKALRAAETALVLAEGIERWAKSTPQLTEAQRTAVSTQLGEALLRVGRNAEARDVFDRVRPAETDGVPTDPLDVRIAIGRAKALLRLGEANQALPIFNRLATGLSADAPIRWEALLGDLSCRTALAHPPEGIIRVIQQQRQLYPDLGGPKLAPRFEQLLAENERRLPISADD